MGPAAAAELCGSGGGQDDLCSAEEDVGVAAPSSADRSCRWGAGVPGLAAVTLGGVWW